MLGISEAAENIGFKTLGVHITAEQLKNDVPLPCIVHWKQCHFVVLYKIRKGVFYVADPVPTVLLNIPKRNFFPAG